MPAGDTDPDGHSDPAFDLRDIPAALGLLTRLPFPVDGDWAMARGAKSAWAYPLAGCVLGLAGLVLAFGLGWLGVPPSMVALVILSLWVFCTGALHEDGLADTFDGLWGGWDRDRRLEIMKDSRIGTYGVIALALSLAIRWQGLAMVIDGQMWWAFIAVPTASRAVMPALMRLPNARPSGLSSSVGQPTGITAWVGAALGILSLLPLGPAGVVAGVIIGATAFALRQVALAKIGGQTGDTLGAAQQLCEAAAWIVLAAVVSA